MAVTGNEKNNIKRLMEEKSIGVPVLCKKTNISLLKMFYLMYVPFSKIKLSQGLQISKVLGVSMSQLF